MPFKYTYVLFHVHSQPGVVADSTETILQSFFFQNRQGILWTKKGMFASTSYLWGTKVEFNAYFLILKIFSNIINSFSNIGNSFSNIRNSISNIRKYRSIF